MLLRFGMENSGSIRDYQEITFAAASIKDAGVNLLKIPGNSNDLILPVIAVYGSNASGKSNLLNSLEFIKRGILISHAERGAQDKIGRDAFRLDPIYKKKPSKFDCDFVIRKTRFHYGFIVDERKVWEEWLYAYPLDQRRQKRQVWFHRNDRQRKKYYFGKELRGRNQTIAELTRPNSLFMSAAAQNNHEQLLPIFSFFKNDLIFREFDDEPQPRDLSTYLKNARSKEWFLEFLKLADTGIVDVLLERREIPDKMKPFGREMMALVQKYAPKGVELPKDLPRNDVRLRFIHKGSRGKSVKMELDDQSTGTKSLLAILGAVFEALQKGRTLVIDELNTSLHTHVSRQIVRLFNSRKTNRGGGQLLFSTHDTNLLSGQLRRDQVWFTEKTPNGTTVVYPLTNIHTRPTDNIEKGYLQGKFGAIPFPGECSFP